MSNMAILTSAFNSLKELPMTDDQAWYTVQEVANKYDVSIRTVTRWINQEPTLLPGTRKQNPFGSRSPYRIPQSALDYYERLLAASQF